LVLRRVLQLLAVGGVGAMLALLSWRLIAASAGSDLVSSIRSGKHPVAPSFQLPVLWPHTETWPPALTRALADGKVSPRELRGYPVVINFWASWCVPCKAEAPRLVASARRHSGKVAFLAIDIQDFKSDARRFLRHFRTDYVSVRDGGGATYADYGLTGVPETYYLGPSGRIVGHSAGEVSTAELEAGIALATGREHP
jgi:cytochrome c biogenesis protein CcmG/thiol:disulfide interchange protein DsbE